MLNVVLFGGSFDPIHAKHLSIINELSNDYDEVWVIVAKSSPFKNTHYASFKDRLEMVKLAINNPKVKVLDIEEVNDFKYTFDTVQYLNDKYDHKFYFAIGSDNKDSLTKWYKYEELKTLVEFVVFDRTTISSTLVRIKKDCGIDIVNEYIKNNNLYYNKYEADFEKLLSVVDEKRFNHTVYVYSLIMELAAKHNLGVDKCAKAAIYHDYYKSIADEDYINEFKKEYAEYVNFSNNVMHGVIAALKLDLEQEVLDAIKYHTTGKTNASKLTKALYISDYCERSRYYHEEVKDILELALVDLDKAYEVAFNKRRSIVKEKYGINKDIEEFIK